MPEAEAQRQSVRWFAEQMEKKLRANDFKGGWEAETIDHLLLRLDDERKELWDATGITLQIDDTYYLNIIDECADVANFAHMIADLAEHARYKLRERAGATT